MVGLGGYGFGHGSLGVFGRRPIAQGAVWSDGIIIVSVFFKLFPGLLQGKEDLGIQQLIPKPSIERFNIAVLGWFAWTDEVQMDAMSICPGVQYLAGKLRPIINGDGLRQRLTFEDCRLKGFDYLAGTNRMIGKKNRTRSVKVFDYGQNPESLPIGQLVCHKVHGPAQRRGFCHGKRYTRQGSSFLSRVLTYLQSLGLVDVIHPLFPYIPAFPSQHRGDAPVAHVIARPHEDLIPLLTAKP